MENATTSDYIALSLNVLGAVFALVFSVAGSAIALARKGKRILSMDQSNEGYRLLNDTSINMEQSQVPFNTPSYVWKSFCGIVIASFLSVCGLIVATLITSKRDVDVFEGIKHLGGGLTVGLSCLFSGYCLGEISNVNQKYFTSSMMLDVFALSLGLYGVIISLLFLA